MSDINYYTLYSEKNSIIQENGGLLVSSYDFYRDLFPIGSFERRGHYDDERPNGVFIILDDSGVSRYMLTDELSLALGDTFSIMSPVSYFGRERNGRNARELYSFTIDLDGVGLTELENLLYQFSTKFTLKPTYLKQRNLVRLEKR